MSQNPLGWTSAGMVSMGDVVFATRGATIVRYEEGQALTIAEELIGALGRHLAAAGGRLYVASDWGVHRWDDTARAWLDDPSRETGGPTDLRSVTAHGAIVVGVSDRLRLWRSVDRGESWVHVEDVRPRGLVTFVDGMLYSHDYGWLSRSLDFGDTWNTPLTRDDLGRGNVGPPFSVGGTIYAGSSSLLRSRDRGVSWARIETDPYPGVYTRSGAGRGSTLLLGTNDGIRRSEDSGRSWRAAHNGVVATQVSQLVATSSAILANVHAGSFWRSLDDGETWGLAATPIPRRRNVALLSDGNAMYVTYRHVNLEPPHKWIVLRSADAAESWSLLDLPNAAFLCMVRTDDGLLAGTQRGLLASQDEGATWQARGEFSGDIERLTRHGSALYAVTTHEPGLARILRSQDGGHTWQRTRFPRGQTPVLVRALRSGVYAMDRDDLNYRYDPARREWDPTEDTTNISLASVVEARGGYYAVSRGSSTVSRSADGGSWAADPTSYVPARISALTTKGSYLFAATSRRGVWRSESFAAPRPDLTHANLVSWGGVKRTRLLPTFPNPTGRMVWIPFELAQPANVTIDIYAVDGSPVWHAHLGQIPAGVHASRADAPAWNGKNQLGERVAEGVYMLALTLPDRVLSRRIIVGP